VVSENRFAPFITSAQSMTALHRSPFYHGHTIGDFGGRGSNRWHRKRTARPKHSASASKFAVLRNVSFVLLLRSVSHTARYTILSSASNVHSCFI